MSGPRSGSRSLHLNRRRKPTLLQLRRRTSSPYLWSNRRRILNRLPGTIKGPKLSTIRCLNRQPQRTGLRMTNRPAPPINEIPAHNDHASFRASRAELSAQPFASGGIARNISSLTPRHICCSPRVELLCFRTTHHVSFGCRGKPSNLTAL